MVWCFYYFCYFSLSTIIFPSFSFCLITFISCTLYVSPQKVFPQFWIMMRMTGTERKDTVHLLLMVCSVSNLLSKRNRCLSLLDIIHHYSLFIIHVCMSVCQTALISSTQVAMVTASLLNFLVSVNIWVASWWALLSLGGSYSQKCKAVCFHGYISATATSFPTFWSIIYVCGVNIVGVRASLSEDF